MKCLDRVRPNLDTMSGIIRFGQFCIDIGAHTIRLTCRIKDSCVTALCFSSTRNQVVGMIIRHHDHAVRIACASRAPT